MTHSSPGSAALIEAEAKRRCTKAGPSLGYLACQDRRFAHDDRRPWWEAMFVGEIEGEIERLEEAGFVVTPAQRPLSPSDKAAGGESEPVFPRPGTPPQAASEDAAICQCMCTDGDDDRDGANLWMDIPKDDFESMRARPDIRSRVVYAAPPQAAPTPNFFGENVDAWGAAEWFDRLAKAIRQQDAAVVAGDTMTMETCQNVAASSAMRLVRDYEQQVRVALSRPERP
jgi:hypothetical protein